MRFLSIFFLVLCGSAFSLAQTGTITGKIVDKSNNGFPEIIVFLENQPKFRTKTNLEGDFSLKSPIGTQIVVIQSGEENLKITVEVSENEIVKIGRIKLETRYFDGIEVVARAKDYTIDDLPPIEVQQIPGPQNSVEKYLSLTTAATSNNELTNNYNVRGGSYDENLVYVNGFEIYRPFLTRSGQQEGMSFINPSLVESIAFSAGGFTANYGDRLSSVLDIVYRTPNRFRGSLDASLLGVNAHVEDAVNTRFNYMVSGRYQDQSYLLNALPVQGAYNPKYYDFQFLTNYALRENLTWSVLGHFSTNKYLFAPETQETKFGTVSQPLSFKVYFEGQEVTKFQTITGATSLKWKVNRKTDLDFYAKIFNTDEQETFDILGEYFINELETDPAKEEFGDSAGTLGIGAYLNHARNRLRATVYSFRHEGKFRFLKLSNDGFEYVNNGQINWGFSAQYEDFYDKISEWGLVDSAGFSLPQNNPDKVELHNVIKAENTLQSFRTSAFILYGNVYNYHISDYPVALKTKRRDSLNNKIKGVYRDTLANSHSQLSFNAGIRTGYTAFNDEFYITPRAMVSYFPRKYFLTQEGTLKKRYLRLHASTGFYYQPPFYRELRNPMGNLNLQTKSQKSFHFVSGIDYAFEMWQREMPFKLTGEIFYKYLWDVNPYHIDNVRTLYFAENNAIGHTYGIDFNLHGEFIEGIQSFFKMGLLRSVEDLKDDFYYEYYNSDGEKIIPGYTFNKTPVDSTQYSPGFIPKPTDQWFNFATLVQDRMPGFEQFTVQLGLNFGSRLPYGPPGQERYKDTLRQTSYFRVDIGFGYDFLYNKPAENRKKIFRPFTDIRLNFEVFNLLGIKNVLSQQWVQDTEGRFFPIPNHLTHRRFNLKLILRW